MKKAIGIIVLGLLWCNISFAESINYVCKLTNAHSKPFDVQLDLQENTIKFSKFFGEFDNKYKIKKKSNGSVVFNLLDPIGEPKTGKLIRYFFYKTPTAHLGFKDGTSYVDCHDITKLVIAKKEPTQTQQVADSSYCFIPDERPGDNRKNSFFYFKINDFKSFQKKWLKISKFAKIDSTNKNPILNLCEFIVDKKTNLYAYLNIGSHYKFASKRFYYMDKTASRLYVRYQIQIAKKEPTQTQQVAKKEPKKKKQTQTQQVAKIDKTKKSSSLFKKEEKKITVDEVVALGTYQEFESYPEGMLKEFGNCNKQLCRGKIAGKKIYEIFVKRGPLWHERYPGDMIHGMAWFEIMYLEKLRKTKKQIERYTKNGPVGYSSNSKMKRDVNALHSLIKMNKGKIRMREALGLSAKDDLTKVLRSHWLLGDLLNNDTYKVKKVRLNSDLKKRKKLLEKYQASLKQYKEKLEKEN